MILRLFARGATCPIDFRPSINSIMYVILTMRTSKSFTIEREIDKYVANTRGERSASDRVNELLKRAILQERLEKLEEEAAAFFSDARNATRKDARAFQKASMRTLARD